MATAVMNAPFLAPRPNPWQFPNQHFLDMPKDAGKENHPGATAAALEQLQQTAPAARARRERPCDGCRRRKSRCVLQESRRCVLCEFHKQECTFVENAQPRKRKTLDDAEQEQQQPRKTSTGPASQQRSVVGRNDSHSGSAASRRVSSTSQLPTGQATATTSSPTQSTSMLAPATVSKLPFAVNESLSLQPHRHCKHLGHTTALDATLVGLSAFDSRHEMESRLGRLRRVTGSEFFSTHDDGEVSLPADEAAALAEISSIVGPHGPALIEIYFRNVHPSYPIIQKQIFLDRHRHGDRQFNPPLLAAMYLLALPWWDSQPELAPHPQPDAQRLEFIAMQTLMVSFQRPKMSAVQAGLLLLQRSSSGATTTTSSSSSNTWSLTVQLVSLGQDIGLHLDSSDWAIPQWERRLRKRLAWALYIQDKWAALVHGRPSHIFAADWAVQPLTHEDFDESTAPYATVDSNGSHEVDDPESAAELARGRSLFMHLISLTGIMAEVCSAFYSPSALSEFKQAGAGSRAATQLVLLRAKPVQLRLKEWFARLPADCKVDTGMASVPPSPLAPTGVGVAAGALQLAYFATEISIHRRIVQALALQAQGQAQGQAQSVMVMDGPDEMRDVAALQEDSTALQPPSSPPATTTAISTTAPQPPSSPQPKLEQGPQPLPLQKINPAPIDPRLLSICRSAAKHRLISSMDFINRLTPTHLNSFWYFSSTANLALIGTFGALLQATSPGEEEAQFYSARLREFRWTLAVSLPRASWVRGAVEIVEGVGGMLGGMGGKPRVGSTVDGGVGSVGNGQMHEVSGSGFEDAGFGVGLGLLNGQSQQQNLLVDSSGHMGEESEFYV